MFDKNYELYQMAKVLINEMKSNSAMISTFNESIFAHTAQMSNKKDFKTLKVCLTRGKRHNLVVELYKTAHYRVTVVMAQEAVPIPVLLPRQSLFL